MKSRFFGSIALSMCVISFSFAAHAQVSTSIGLDLTPSTTSPIPGQMVTITARSYTIDINSSKVSWYVDGKLSKTGVGQTLFEIRAPALGAKISIDVTATNPDGVVLKASTIVGSGSVDVIFESDGYTPPLFKGKMPPVYQNTVTIIAIPHLANSAGIEYDPATLVYQWKKGGRAIEDQSGYGKRAITLVGEVVPRPYDISVTVWPKDNSSSATAYAEVRPYKPNIEFYIDDPLYGKLFNEAITEAVRIGPQKETTIFAVPFGFNDANNDSTEWAWGINSLKRDALASKQSVVLRAPNDATGSSDIRLSITNINKILQGAASGVSVVFLSNKDQKSSVPTF